MLVFPWLVLILLTLAVSAVLLTLASRLLTRRSGSQARFSAGLLSTLALALPLLLAVLAWGIFIKPR